jgi:hypothetical protein
MTQEEKAKAYDKALERAKEILNSYEKRGLKELLFYAKEDLEEIFPELKESGDERIRKAISIYLDWLDGRKDCAPRGEYSIRDMVAWLEKQGQVKESEISQPIKETSKENNNSLTNKAWSEIQNGIILDGVVYELTTGFPDNKLSLCGNCELNEKCIDFDGSLCYFFADNYRKVFRKVKMERKL